MQRYKLDFRNQNHLAQLAIFRRLAAGCDTLTAAQQQDIPALADLLASTAAADASHARIASLRADMKAELARRKKLFAAARSDAGRVSRGLAGCVNWQPAAMQGVGLELPAPNTVRLGPPPAPENLRVAPTTTEGEVRLRWKCPMRRCYFEVQWHADPADADHWQPEDGTSRHSCVVKGLVSGKKYWFRIRANATAGPGPWSQLVCVRAK